MRKTYISKNSIQKKGWNIQRREKSIQFKVVTKEKILKTTAAISALKTMEIKKRICFNSLKRKAAMSSISPNVYLFSDYISKL